MNYGLWLSAGGMQVNEYRQAILSNNMANADTVGFKHDLAVIQERRVESQANPVGAGFAHRLLDGLTGGPWVRPTVHSFEQGDLVKTGRSLDVAIQGNGFFTVQVNDQPRYTRDGRMLVNEQGELVSVAGDGRIKFLDDAGNPIRVDRTKPVAITPGGVVRQGRAVVGTVGVVDVDDTNKLRKVGQELFVGIGEKTTPSASTLHTGFVERSTVNPVESLASLIEVPRAYELNARMISLQDTLLGQAVGRVGRIG